MLIVIMILALAIAPLMAGAALILRRQLPGRSIGEVIHRLLAWSVLGTLALMLVGCGLTLTKGCVPDDLVCDAPAMAAAGVIMLGATLAVVIAFVGGPVAYLVLRITERK